MVNNELYHYGVSGMKWGVRRYQNKDGSLTSAGKKRANRDLSDLSNNKKKQYSPNANKWVKEDLERSKRLADASSQMTGNLKRINEDRNKKAPKATMDLSNMTDKELRDQINRAFLEKQYNDMFAPQETSKGREYASAVLENAGNVLAVTGSALNVALAIKELKG